MLSFLVLIVLILIVSQISYSTKTDARVSRNEATLIAMDQAIESVFLQAFEDLKSDAAGGGAAAPGGSDPFGGEGTGGTEGLEGGFGGAGAGGGESTDSREDAWARPQRTEMNEMQLRIFVQDEDSKFNILSILTEDEDEAQKAFDRLARILEASRKGTREEIDGGSAQRMAMMMLEYMNRRRDQILPVTEQLSADPDNGDIGLPLTLREFTALDREIFPPELFRDYRDEDGVIVHSLSSFLTVHTSLTTADQLDQGDEPPPAAPPEEEEEPAEGSEEQPTESGGGGAGQEGAGGDSGSADGKVNLNTAPPAVLKSLLDDRDVPYDFWDDIIEFRNEPQEEEEDRDPENVTLDEYGEEIVPKQFFSSFDAISQIDGWVNLEPIQQGELRNLLKTQSSVFSIFVTARRPTGEERISPDSRREDIEREEVEGQGLVRTVRAIVWRRSTEDGEVEIVPLVRWEVLDYVPWEVLDFPDEDR